MTAPKGERLLDLVLLGATGFVGKLVCEELAMNYAGEIQWAIAGRDPDALGRVKEELCKMQPLCKGLEVMRFDVHDQHSVDQVVRSAKVVLSTTGPYALLGEPVLEACVRLGTHYVDLCGEITWIRDMAEKYHKRAETAGVKLVNSCGVEAVAADLSALLLASYMREKFNRKCASVRTVVQAASGFGMGGGSWESFMNMTGNMSWRELVAFQSPYFLTPQGTRKGSDPPDLYIPGYCRELGQFTAPYLLASSDRKVVHRSAALMRARGGWFSDDFRFQEGVFAPGPFSALMLGAAMGAVVTALALRIFHPLLRLITYRPGQGPQYLTQMKGFWKYLSVGQTEEAAGAQPRTVYSIMGDAGRDPGYWSTSRMVLEAALCLALDSKELAQEEGVLPGGVLTPATAMGGALVRRLRKAGYSCIVRESHGLTI